MIRDAGVDDLRVNVTSLLAEPVGSTRDLALQAVSIGLGEDLALARPVRARFRLTRTNRGILVEGDVGAALAETCSRCLQPIEVEVEGEIAEEALPSVELTTGAPVDMTAEPDVARLNKHHELDVEPLVREAIELAALIAALCRPDCPGLCAVCGEPLRDGAHDHGEEPIDPRLEVLRGFRVDAEDENG